MKRNQVVNIIVNRYNMFRLNTVFAIFIQNKNKKLQQY